MYNIKGTRQNSTVTLEEGASRGIEILNLWYAAAINEGRATVYQKHKALRN